MTENYNEIYDSTMLQKDMTKRLLKLMVMFVSTFLLLRLVPSQQMSHYDIISSSLMTAVVFAIMDTCAPSYRVYVHSSGNIECIN